MPSDFTASLDNEGEITTVSDIEDWYVDLDTSILFYVAIILTLHCFRCIDYAYANPSLWLISREGPWYRVMSPLIAGGGNALPSYQPIFDKYLEKFVAAAHCAYCLMDFLPQNRKLSFQNVVDEVDVRSGGRVDDYVLLFHSTFIIEQLSDLNAHDLAQDKEIKFDESFFMSQYKKRAEQFLNLKKEKKRRKKEVCKSLMDKSHGGTIDFSVKDIPVRVKPTKLEPIIPIKDSDYWMAQREAGLPILPFPCPQTSNQLLPSEDAHMLGNVLEAWTIVTNYREFLTLPFFTIETLLGELQKQSYDSSILQEVHLQLLLSILLIPCESGTAVENRTAPCTYTCVQAGSASNDAGTRIFTNSSILWDSIQECCRSCRGDDVLVLVKHFLRQGNMWIEVVRALLNESGEIKLPEYVDAVLVMQQIVEDLLLSPSYQSLVNNVTIPIPDTSDENKTLNDVLNSIKNGDYEGGLHSNIDSDVSSDLQMTKYLIKLKKGTKIDAYSATLRGWYSSEVVEANPQERKVIVRFEGWGVGFDETFFASDVELAPYKTLSVSTQYKDTAPNLVPITVFSALEDEFRPLHARRVIRPAGYVPHSAIAKDVQNILSRVVLASGASDGSDILEDFQEAYESKVLDMFVSNGDKKLSADNELQDMANYLKLNSYDSAPLPLKIKLLCWLCESMVASTGAKQFLEDVIERKFSKEKSSRSIKAKVDEIEASTEDNVLKNGKRPSADMLDEEGGGDPQTLPRANDTIDSIDVRIIPLGKDRDKRTYWVFRNDLAHQSSFCRIFCEDGFSPLQRWTVFSNESDIQLLLNWLSDYGVDEVMLKNKIKTHMSVESAGLVASLPGASVIDTPHMHVRYVNVILQPDQRLEAGVKDLDGRLIISTFNLNDQGHSCAKDAGILICDQIISLNSHPVYDVPSLQNAMALVKQDPSNIDVNGAVKLKFLILRYASPERLIPAVPIALKTDTDFKYHYDQQLRERASGSLMPSCLLKTEERVEFNELIGVILEMLHSTAGVYPSSQEHSFQGSRYFINKISNDLFSPHDKKSETLQSGGIKCGNSRMLSCLRECLLDMEFALTLDRRAFRTNWEKNRRSYKWRQYCRMSSTFVELAVCAFALYQSIDWKELAEITCPVDIAKASSYVPKQVQAYIPKVGQQVIFFGDAYLANTDKPILGCGGVIPSANVACDVLSTKLFKGGSERCRIPSIKLVLKICEANLAPFKHPEVLHPSGSDSKKLNRLLNLAVFVLLAMPESVPFSSAVSINDCPNYYDVILKPMHLGDIQRKILQNKYTDTSQFVDDIEQIRSNCVLYCSELYPSLLPMVETLRTTALDLTRRLFPEISQGTSVSQDYNTCNQVRSLSSASLKSND